MRPAEGPSRQTDARPAGRRPARGVRNRVHWPLLLAIGLSTGGAMAAAAPPAARCTWAEPGHNPFIGDVVAAVDHYTDIPTEVRARLKARMASRAYDEIVDIRRDAIVGQARYRPEIRDMHFGTGQVCATIDRQPWPTDAQERGLVYCEADHCILVPTVCRNVSRITRERPAVAAAQASGAEGGGGGGDRSAGGGDGPAAAADSAGRPTATAALAGPEVAAPTSFIAGLSTDQVAAATEGAPPAAGNGPQPDPPAGINWPAPGWQQPDNPAWLDGDWASSTAVVPEPGTWLMMLAGLAALRRRAARPG